jgi:aryl-alcohol dehydrogenase-like predicted oxidoreductase
MDVLRPLGGTGLRVHPLCLGGNVFGWTADPAASEAVLDAYADAGGNFLDTAECYSGWAAGNSGGESETLIGGWMVARGNRDEMVVATKVGATMQGGPMPRGLRRERIREAVEGSLRRLRTDRIDLYYAHYDDPETPLEETLETLDGLVREGLVRAIGASNISAARLAEALAVSDERGWARYEVLQPHYNLLEREGYEGGLEELCASEGVTCCPYYALARGFLSGKYRPGRPLPESVRAPGVAQTAMNERGFGLLAAIDDVAAAHEATPAQVSVAWLLSRPTVGAPIASATGPEQVRDLMGVASLALDPAEVAALDAAGGGAPAG